MANQRYIVTKYVFAPSIEEAVRLEKQEPVASVALDVNWYEEQPDLHIQGFNTNKRKNKGHG